MNLQEIAISKIKPSPKNIRLIKKSAVVAVKTSIEQYGFNVPLVVSSDYDIVAGHTRYKACKELGYKKVPCVVLEENLDETTLEKIRLLDNQIGEASEWDTKKLQIELRYIFGSSSEDEWKGLAFTFPDMKFLDSTLKIGVGHSQQAVNQGNIDKAEQAKNDRFTGSANKELIEVTCPNCNKTFKIKKI